MITYFVDGIIPVHPDEVVRSGHACLNPIIVTIVDIHPDWWNLSN